MADASILGTTCGLTYPPSVRPRVTLAIDNRPEPSRIQDSILKTRPASLLCLTAFLGVSLSGCAVIQRWTRPVNESLQAPVIEMPGDERVEQPRQRAAGKPVGDGRGTQPQAPVIRSQSPGGDIYGRGPTPVTDATSPPVVNRYSQPGPPGGQPAGAGTFAAPPAGSLPQHLLRTPIPPVASSSPARHSLTIRKMRRRRCRKR